MLTYVYACENCDVPEFEVLQRITDKPKRACPVCKKHTLYRVIQPALSFVRLAYSEVKTLGHLAERNSKRMSQDEKDHLAKDNKTKKEILNRLPAHLKPQRVEKDASLAPDKSLAKLDAKQIERYIETGKK